MCVEMCLCLCLCEDLTFWQLILATKAFSSFWFYFCVIFRSTGREYWQSSWCGLPDGDGALLGDQNSYEGFAVFCEGWPFKKKKHPAVQRWTWVNPSVVSFHVEVMLSKSFGTRLPGWRRDGWMSGVITEYPCSWLNQTSWLLEIKLLCLHVGGWIKIEGSSLSGFRDQAGIFINLYRTDNSRVRCWLCRKNKWKIEGGNHWWLTHIISWKVLINNLKG